MVKMTEEPDDYEGPWPEGGAMTEWVMVPREPTEAQLSSIANIRSSGGSYLWPVMVYRAMLDAAPAAPQMTGEFGHLAGRGMHELRTDELAQYVVSLAAGHGPFSHVVKAALDWIVSELERKTNDERALAVKLDAIRDAQQQADPVGYFVNDESDDQWHQVDYEQRNGADTYPLYLHPPADEVQRLRDAARDVCEWADAAQWALGNETGVPAAKLDALRKALEGGE